MNIKDGLTEAGKRYSPPMHTPGPWVISRARDYEPTGIRIDAESVCGIAYCTDQTPENGYKNRMPDQEQKANAALIAAAPTMLTALIDARDFIEKYVPSADVSWLNGAINRAKGVE